MLSRLFKFKSTNKDEKISLEKQLMTHPVPKVLAKHKTLFDAKDGTYPPLIGREKIIKIQDFKELYPIFKKNKDEFVFFQMVYSYLAEMVELPFQKSIELFKNANIQSENWSLFLDVLKTSRDAYVKKDFSLFHELVKSIEQGSFTEIIQKKANINKITPREEKYALIPVNNGDITFNFNSSFFYSDERKKRHVVVQSVGIVLHEGGVQLINRGKAYIEKKDGWLALKTYHDIPHYDSWNGSRKSGDIFHAIFPMIVALDHMPPDAIYKGFVKLCSELRFITSGSDAVCFPNGSNFETDVTTKHTILLYMLYNKEKFSQDLSKLLELHMPSGQTLEINPIRPGEENKNFKEASTFLFELLQFGKTFTLPHLDSLKEALLSESLTEGESQTSTSRMSLK